MNERRLCLSKWLFLSILLVLRNAQCFLFLFFITNSDLDKIILGYIMSTQIHWACQIFFQEIQTIFPKIHAKCQNLKIRAKFENFQKLASKNSCFIILTHIHSRCQSFLHIYCKSNVQIIKSNFTIETQRNFRKTAPKIKMFKIFKRNQHSHICFKIRLLFFDIWLPWNLSIPYKIK